MTLFEVLREELLRFSKYSSSELEFHICIVEIVCGAAAAARKYDDEDIRQHLWLALFPAMVRWRIVSTSYPVYSLSLPLSSLSSRCLPREERTVEQTEGHGPCGPCTACTRLASPHRQ